MKYTALEIANILQGNVIGDSSITVNSIAKIEEGKKGVRQSGFASSLQGFFEFLHRNPAQAVPETGCFGGLGKRIPNDERSIRIRDSQDFCVIC